MPERRGPSPMVLVLILLLAIATVTGVAAWYLVLSRPSGTSTTTGTVLGEATPLGSPSAAATASAGSSGRPSVPGFQRSPSAGGSSAPADETGSAATPSIDPTIVAQIDAVVSQVPAIRTLQPKQSVPYRFITREQFATEFQDQFDKENPIAQLRAEEALDKRLGLLPQDADLKALATALYTSQVVAFYDPAREDFTVIQGPDQQFTAADRVTVAHEYDHALQDQYWDLLKLQKIDPSEGDRAVAFTALAEGDATALMYQWAFAHLTPAEIGSLDSSVTPDDQQLLDSMPLLLRQSLLFPYLTGVQFVTDLQQHGGWSGVNDAWADPPVSSEQIMHPQKYGAGEHPIPVALPDLARAVGGGWRTATTDVAGEFVTGTWLADGQGGGAGALGLPAPLANADAAAGWGGDRIVSLDGPNGTWAVVWQTTWDTPQDANEFSAAANGVMADLPGAHEVLATSLAGDLASPELVLVASDQATLHTLKQDLALGD